jgi:hypothetical protein
MREQNRVSGILANNLFWVLYLIGQGGAGLFVMVMVGAVALFPLCADPFRKLPVERIGTWPLTARNLHLIRIVSIFLSPAAWIALATILWTRRPQFLLLAFFLIAFAVPFPKSLAFRAVPGIFGELVRKNVRELLTLLDPYVALLFSASAILYRLARPAMEDDARITMSLVVVVTLSTCAQCLFALDAGPGLDRYRLMPIRGWRVLAAKHAAHLLVALPLTLPIHPIAPIAGLLVSLGIGNHMAVTNPRLQSRWSLTAGSLIPGLFQSAAIIAAGLNATREPIWIGAFALFYVVSTLFYGWRLDSQSRGQAGR